MFCFFVILNHNQVPSVLVEIDAHKTGNVITKWLLCFSKLRGFIVCGKDSGSDGTSSGIPGWGIIPYVKIGPSCNVIIRTSWDIHYPKCLDGIGQDGDMSCSMRKLGHPHPTRLKILVCG